MLIIYLGREFVTDEESIFDFDSPNHILWHHHHLVLRLHHHLLLGWISILVAILGWLLTHVLGGVRLIPILHLSPRLLLFHLLLNQQNHSSGATYHVIVDCSRGNR